MIKNCKTKGCNNKVEEKKYCIDCAMGDLFSTKATSTKMTTLTIEVSTKMTKQQIEKKRKKLLALGKDPRFVEMLLKGAVEPKRMF